MKKLLLCILTSMLVTLWCPTIAAHPHVFITPRSHFAFSGNTFNFFSVRWYFDDMTTIGLLGNKTANATISLSDSEQNDILKLEGFPSPSQLNSFCYVEIDGLPVSLPSPADVKLTVDNGRLVYCFTYGVYRSVNKAAKIWFNDRTYFVAFETTSGYYTVSQSTGAEPSMSVREESDVNKISIRL